MVRCKIIYLCVSLMCIFSFVETTEDVDGRFRTLQQDVEYLKRVVLELKESNEKYARENRDLRDTDRAHAAKLMTLEQTNERLEKMLIDCKCGSRAEWDKFEKFVSAWSSTDLSSEKNVSYWNKAIDVNKKDINQEKQVKRLLLGSTGQPSAQHETNAFYAYMSTSELHPGQHQIIVFDVDVTNLGHGYSKNSGIFTVPITGVFVFTWAIASYPPHDYSFTEIVVNSTPKGIIHTCSADGSCGRVETGIVVLMVNKDDEVFVRTSPSQAIVGRIYSENDIRSTFSGWQIA